MNNSLCTTSQPFPEYFTTHCGFALIMDFFNINQESIKRIPIEEQTNGYDCGYRTLFNMYCFGLSESINPLIDHYNEKKFSVFVELLCLTTKIAEPRMTIEECLSFINEFK